MDLEEWELLSDEEEEEEGSLLLQVIDYERNKHHPASAQYFNNATSVLRMNYFICPPPLPPSPSVYVDKTRQRDHHHQLIHLETATTSDPMDPLNKSVDTGTDPISQLVIFKKMKDTKFVDIKVGCNQLEAKGDLGIEKRNIELVEEAGGGINILKWSLSGIGAICSFGVAAVCIIVFSSHRKNNHPQRNQMLGVS